MAVEGLAHLKPWTPQCPPDPEYKHGIQEAPLRDQIESRAPLEIRQQQEIQYQQNHLGSTGRFIFIDERAVRLVRGKRSTSNARACVDKCVKTWQRPRLLRGPERRVQKAPRILEILDVNLASATCDFVKVRQIPPYNEKNTPSTSSLKDRPRKCQIPPKRSSKQYTLRVCPQTSRRTGPPQYDPTNSSLTCHFCDTSCLLAEFLDYIKPQDGSMAVVRIPQRTSA